ncbi:hypothetical protein ACLOJK_010377 [Asimina triloba]
MQASGLLDWPALRSRRLGFGPCGSDRLDRRDCAELPMPLLHVFFCIGEPGRRSYKASY